MSVLGGRLGGWFGRGRPAPNFEARRTRDTPEQPFIRSAATYLSGVGYGFCFVTCPAGVTWRVEHQAVSTNINRALQVPQPIVKIYPGPSPSGNVIDSTYNGDFANSDTVLNVLPGDSLCAEWYCDTAAQASHAGLLASYVVRGFQKQVMA